MLNRNESFFAELRQKFFSRRLNWEIFERLFFHLKGDKNHGYPFSTEKEMNAQTEAFEAQELFDKIELQISRMPTGYGECFRHVMHRDLQQRLRQYEREARRRVNPPKIDPRYIATRA